MRKKLLLLEKGIDVIRGTSKEKGPASDLLNKINKKYQGRYFFERAKTKKADEQRVKAAKSFARSKPPKQTPFSYPSQRQGRLGRIIVPKSALKRQKVDRKLTKEVRKDKQRGGSI